MILWKIQMFSFYHTLQNFYFRECNWPEGSSCSPLKSMTAFALRILSFQHASTKYGKETKAFLRDMAFLCWSTLAKELLDFAEPSLECTAVLNSSTSSPYSQSLEITVGIMTGTSICWLDVMCKALWRCFTYKAGTIASSIFLPTRNLVNTKE